MATTSIDSFTPFAYNEQQHHIRLNAMLAAVRSDLSTSLDQNAAAATAAAAAQVTLAQAQVTLATTQAGNAATSASNAATSATNASNSAAAAAGSASAAATSATNAANSAAAASAVTGLPNPTGNARKFMRVNNAANGYLLDDAIPQATLPDSGLTTFTAGVNDGDLLMVPDVGLYRWNATETTVPAGCLVVGPTGGGTGRWLLECPGWEVVQAYLAADLTRLHGFADRTLFGSGTCTASSIASLSAFDFNVTVAGAALGDRVVATPPGLLDARLNWHAVVTAPSIVSIRINNASASAASANVGAGTWPVVVIKGVTP